MTWPSPDTLHTTAQAAAALDVPPSLIRQWRSRGQIMPDGLLPAAVPGGLQPLYKLAELQPLADRYHQRKARRRR